MKIWYLPLALIMALPVQAEIKVVYGDNPAEATDVQNVKEIKNSYDSQIAELEVRHKQEQDELRVKNDLEIEAEKERSNKEIAEKNAEIERKKKELAKLETESAERARKENQMAQINRDYNLSVDLTKKIIRHTGMMPTSLPAVSSEGIEAPLVAAFNSLIPMDWKVYVHQSISDQTRISWQSQNENWVATLYKVGVRYGYSFDINWNERWILVNKGEIRFGNTNASKPKIEVMGSDVPAGQEGYMLIDGKIMKVRRSN